MGAVDALGGWSVLLGTIADRNELSRGEARAALADILAGEATDAQIAGLIVGLRMKGETVEEMTGLATAMLDVSEPLTVPEGAIDIVGTGGSGHRRAHAMNISTMASIVAAAAGAIVCKHGNRKASSTSGSFDFLEAIGVNVDLTPSELERCIASAGVGFAFARTFHPSMRFVGPVRAELGIPTVFNVLGPLANPGRVSRQVVGASTVELAEKMALVLQNLGTVFAWVVTGAGGIDELTTTGSTTVIQLAEGEIERFEVVPGDVGLALTPSLDDLAGGSAEDNAKLFASLIDGTETGPRRDVVLLNAAAGLLVAGIVDNLRSGVELAGAALDDGRVGSKLAALIDGARVAGE